MRKKRNVIIIGFIILMVVMVGVIAYKLQSNKESTSDRIQRKASETDAEKEKAGSTEKAYDDGCGDNILNVGSAQIEMLSVDILEGEELANETKYPVENFYKKCMPVAEYTNTHVDRDTMFAESPEFEKAFTTPTRNEEEFQQRKEALEKYADFIEEHTTEVIVTNKIYFVKCRITNTSGVDIDTALPLCVTYVSQDTGAVSYMESLRYFDKSAYTEGDDRLHKFYNFKLGAHETMECVIGLAVPADIEETQPRDWGNVVYHYYGADIPDGSSAYDPDAFPNLIKLDDLPRTED